MLSPGYRTPSPPPPPPGSVVFGNQVEITTLPPPPPTTSWKCCLFSLEPSGKHDIWVVSRPPWKAQSPSSTPFMSPASVGSTAYMSPAVGVTGLKLGGTRFGSGYPLEFLDLLLGTVLGVCKSFRTLVGQSTRSEVRVFFRFRAPFCEVASKTIRYVRVN